MKEANEEDEHKCWPDNELATNYQRERRKLRPWKPCMQRSISLKPPFQLTEDIGELTKAVGEPDVAMASATKFCQELKAENTETIYETDEAVDDTAVAQAFTVLKDFYAKIGEHTAFIQQKAQPEIFDKP